MSFQLSLVCDRLDNINEGIEFSLRLGANRDWIPVAFFFRGSHSLNSIAPGKIVNGTLVIRGFQVEEVTVQGDSQHQYTLRVCSTIKPIRLRWLQTTNIGLNSIPRDVWSLDDIVISYQNGEGTENISYEDSFDTK